MNGWTHFSFRMLWFTCKASASVRVPSAEIMFPLRLQNDRNQEMRGGSTNHFILCVKDAHNLASFFCHLQYDTASNRKLGGDP